MFTLATKLLALGVIAALYERERHGIGEVIDAAMVDGAALLTSYLHGMRATGLWNDERGTNALDGQPAPAPRFSRTPAPPPRPVRQITDTAQLRARWDHCHDTH